MSRKIKIRIEQGKVVERDVPDISLDLKPEYPRKWFDDHPGSKPILRVPKFDLSEDQLLGKMGDYWLSDPEIEPTLEFVYHFMINNLKERLPARWKSYGRVIGEKDQVITPIDLFNVERYDVNFNTEFGPRLKAEEEAGRFAMIMAIHRAHTTIGEIGDYPARVMKQMENTLREPPYNLKAMDPGLISAKVSWGSNETFKKMAAAIDMFYNKFRNSPYAKIKVATRDKDCGRLIAITDLASYLGETTTNALSYAMDPRVGPKLVRLTEELDEISDPNSYFHYMREMGLSNKSPYSSSMNPVLYNFTYSVGSFMGNKRACNARLFSDSGFTNTVNLAVYVAFYFRKWVNISIVAEDDKLLKLADSLDEVDDSAGEEKKDCLYIYSKILSNGNEVTPEIRRELKKVISGLNDLREGTIGKQIQQMFM